jgi:hypothetical protein
VGGRSADRKLAAGVASDGYDAAIDLRRVGRVDFYLGLAGGFALFQGGVVEKRKTHRALDLQRPILGEKDRGSVRVDAPNLLPAMGCGIGKKGQHFFLAIGAIRHKNRRPFSRSFTFAFDSALIRWRRQWSGFDIRYPPGRERVKRMSNPKLH